MWTYFYSNFVFNIDTKSGVFRNPIFIEERFQKAIERFNHIYGEEILESSFYEIKEFSTLEEVTAKFRGCIIRTKGFLEESRGSKDFPYCSINKYLLDKSVGFIYQKFVDTADGAKCKKCKDFCYMADPNAEGGFFCRSCRLNPYRG